MRPATPILCAFFLALLALGCNRSNDAAVTRSAVTPPSSDEPKSSQKSIESNTTVARTADGAAADEPKTGLNAKPNAKLKMEQALARHDQIDRHIKSLQNPSQVGRLTAQGVPVRQVVRPVPPELLRQRDEAWQAYLEACKVYNDLP